MFLLELNPSADECDETFSNISSGWTINLYPQTDSPTSNFHSAYTQAGNGHLNTQVSDSSYNTLVVHTKKWCRNLSLNSDIHNAKIQKVFVIFLSLFFLTIAFLYLQANSTKFFLAFIPGFQRPFSHVSDPGPKPPSVNQSFIVNGSTSNILVSLSYSLHLTQYIFQ